MKLNREGVQLNAEERNKRNQNWATLEVELDGIGEKIADSGDAKELAENVQAQVNALVVQGDSSVEARQARVDAKGVEAATLKARLDAEQNAVTQQLADKVGSGKKAEMEDLSDAVISAVTGGATVNVLSIPQDKSVTAKKTDFFEISKNLYNPNDVNFLAGKAFSGFTDTIVDSATANITGNINVNPGDRLLFSKSGVEVGNTNSYKIIFYKPDGTFRSGQYYVLGGVVIPADSNRVRIQTDSAAISLQIEKGTAVSSYEAFYEPRLISSVIPDIPFAKVVNIAVTPDETTFIKSGKNLFNPNDTNVILGGYYNASNVLTTATTHNQTGLIPVTPGQRYTASYKGAFVNWYGKAGIFLGSTLSATFSSQGYVEAVAGAYFARFIAILAEWTNFQVEAGQTSTSYEAYFKLLDSKYLPPTLSNPLNTVRFTSYGDSLTAQAMWQSHVVSYFRLVHTNLGVSSSSLAYVADREAQYPSFVNQARIDSLIASNPDIVTILGGTNDAHLAVPVGTDTQYTTALASKDKATFKGAYSFLIETLLTWKPTLEIIMLTPMQSGYNNPYSTYADATKSVAKFYALPIVDLFTESGFSKFNINTYTSDLLHPNAAGGKRIANMVIDKLKMIGTV